MPARHDSLSQPDVDRRQWPTAGAVATILVALATATVPCPIVVILVGYFLVPLLWLPLFFVGRELGDNARYLFLLIAVSAGLVTALLVTCGWGVRRLLRGRPRRVRQLCLIVGSVLLLGLTLTPVYGTSGERELRGSLADLLLDEQLYRATFTRVQIAILGSPE